MKHISTDINFPSAVIMFYISLPYDDVQKCCLFHETHFK